MVLRQRVSLLVAPLVPAEKVEVEILAPEFKTAAPAVVQRQWWWRPHEFDENGHEYTNDLCIGDGMQPPVPYSAEVMSSVTDRSVGVQCDTAELKTAGAQTDESDDAWDSSAENVSSVTGRSVGVQCDTAELRTAGAQIDESYDAGDSSAERMSSVTDGSVGLQCDTAELKKAGAQTDENDDDTMAPLSLSVGDQAAGGALAPTTDTTGAERRISDECPAVELESGDEVTAITHQADSAAQAEQEAGCDGDYDAPPKGTAGLPETMHIDVAASDEGSEAETSDGDSESDEPYSPDLDTVFDAIGELAGKDGRDWVPMRQLQARTSLSLERLEELLEEWVFMGVIGWNDTRS